jgi:opacity protein-like surface antigen
MTKTCIRPTAVLLAICFVFPAQVLAQGYDEPLTIQGLDHNTLSSAASRAVGGTTMGLVNDVGVLFSNPAALQTLKGIQLSLGGLQQYSRANQTQQYSPLKYYSNFSLLMEGLTGSIPNPRYSDSLGIVGTNIGDTVQRPYDAIGPNWSRARTKGTPLQAILGAPFSIGKTNLVVGLGVVEYANLNHFYQNNNVLSPSILSERPLPLPRPPTDSLPVVTTWSQFARSRDGSLRGYGGALSVEISEEISLGVSGMVLKGSTDDVQQHVGRGKMTFYTNYFRLDSTYERRTRVGRSDYSGSEFTVSGIYRGRYLSVGLSVKPPTAITRTYTAQVLVDTTSRSTSAAVSGQDKLKLPWRGTIGLSITPKDNLTFALEYELRSYESAVYTCEDGTVSNPWLSSAVFHGGVELRPLQWLALRAGIHGQAEVFEPEGNPIVGEPVGYTVYSAGFGLSYAGIHLNVAYEYASMRYQDVWGSAISLNTDTRHTVIADITYDLPWVFGK